MEYINGLLKAFGIEVPAYLTTLLIHNGFDNIYSLSQFNLDEDIERIECYAREVLSKVLKGDEKKAIFGIFTEECSLFKIPEGHKKLLRFIKEESEKKLKLLKRPLECEEPEEVTGESSSSKKKRKVTNNNISQSETGNRADTDGDILSVSNNDCMSQDNNCVVQHVINISQSYIDKFSREEFRNGKINKERLKEILNKSKNLNVKMDDDLTAKIYCPLCAFISSAYSVKNSKIGRKWVVSNFLRHYRTHFKGKSITTKLSRKLFIEPQPHTSKQSNLLNFMKKNASNKCEDLNLDENLIDLTNPETNPNDAASTSSELQIQNNILIDNNYDCFDESPPRLHQDIPETDYDTPSQTHNNNLSDNEHQEVSQIANDMPISDLEYHSSTFEDICFLDSDILEVSPSGNNDASEQANPSKSKSLFSGSNSRRERCLRVLNELPYHQVQITTFLNVLNDAIDKNPEVTKTLNIITQNQTINTFNFNTKGLLKYLLESAIKNSKNKSGNANKFDAGMKRFWLYIFISAGKMSYEILYSNLKNILPSITTIHRQLEEMNNILEGVVRIEELKLYLEKRNYPPVIFISEDQTALIKKVQYDSSTNQMTGFVAPLQEDTGFPSVEKFSVHSVYDIENAFKKETLAINAYVFMAQPLVNGSPAFCISIFGSDNRFTSDDVSKRWQYLKSEAAIHGITVLGFSSNGDPRCLKSMKIMSKLPLTSENPYSPYFQANFNLENPTVFQDTVHISTKLKTRLLNESISMNMGGKRVSIDNIRNLIENYCRDKHLLCKSFLESSDKMNFNAIDKMSSEQVTNLLKEIPDAEATRQYLILTRYILNAFLLKELSVEKRVYLIWYTTFFMRIWKSWLKKKGENIQKNFITSNAYTCIELNAHGIILVIEKLRLNQIPETFLPWLYSSQPCENIFRETRSMSSTFSTMVNYTLLEILGRLKRIQAMHEISTDLGTDFRFPRQENKRLGNDSCAIELTELPSIEVIKETIEKAKEDALLHARQLGMEMSSDCCIHVDLPINYNNNPEEEEEEHESLDESIVPSDMVSENEQQDLSNEDREFLEYTSTFSSYDSLQLKDYSGQKKSQKSCLTVTLNDRKTRVIKKSTLIWFFQQNQGRLSTDRILRVKGMSLKKLDKKESPRESQTKKQYKKKSSKELKAGTVSKRKLVSQEEDDSTSASESEINYASETMSEEFSNSDDGHNEITQISIQLESYYAVYYDEQWYLGRVISSCKSEKFKIKFFQQILDSFKWPKKDDIQEVHRDFIFYGPVNLIGAEPFSLKRKDFVAIQKKYKSLKK